MSVLEMLSSSKLELRKWVGPIDTLKISISASTSAYFIMVVYVFRSFGNNNGRLCHLQSLSLNTYCFHSLTTNFITSDHKYEKNFNQFLKYVKDQYRIGNFKNFDEALTLFNRMAHV